MFAGGVVTVKSTPLLATPPRVTTTLPVVAPFGTGTTMLVALQLVGVADVPLKVTVLVPCEAPKLVPVMVTEVPKRPEVGLRLVIAGVTVKLTPLLGIKDTLTTTLPVVAPAGTGTTMLVELQLVGNAAMPLNATELATCVGPGPNPLPLIVTVAPTGPEAGLMLVILGGRTVKLAPELATPPTVTTTLPVLVAGTRAVMLVELQLVTAAPIPLKVMLLVPCDAPKFVPVTVTEVPI